MSIVFTKPAKFSPDHNYDFMPVEGMPPNVCWVKRSSYSSDKPINVECRLHRLLCLVATENPTWAFYARSFSSIALDEFEIYSGEEWIGKLEYNNGKFHVGCPAIADTMDRKRYKSVKDEAKAYKLTKMMRPKGIGEYFKDSVLNVKGAVRSLVSDFSYQAKRSVDDLFSYFVTFVHSYPEEARALLVDRLGCDVTKIDLAISRQEEYQGLKDMKDAIDKRIGYRTVMLKNDMYVLDNPPDAVNEYWVTKDSEALPPTIRRNLGLLKLSEVGTAIPSIGFRFSDTEFFVKE